MNLYGINFTRKGKDCLESFLDEFHDNMYLKGMFVMARRVVEFSNGGYKIRKIFALESTYPKKIIEF